MRTLPPFDGLVAFEAAARHRSMTLAANELRITQSAISHRLKKLETFVGALLFNRTGTGLSPTPAGISLLGDIGKLLDDMAGLRARSRAAAKPAILKVGVGAALAQYWLVRRLPGFSALNPDIGLELVVTESDAQARAADIDVLILWQPKSAARPNSTQRLLFNEYVFPVAAPRLVPRGRPLPNPMTLINLPIIHKGPAGRNDGAEWSWPVWFERLGIETSAPVAMRFDTLSLALAAALEGAGVVLARSLLVHDAVAERRLCRVLPPKWDMPSSKAHFVRWQAVLTGDKRVGRFTSWIIDEADRTSARS
ncbi:MAG: LysR family transcriptional regulator [Proteobacteria bacterium]|nr:LysR family transcriptional regulator [Pseudomonadota bacterium]